MPIGAACLARGMLCRPPLPNQGFVGLALVICLVVTGCAAPTMSQPPASETTHVANETTAWLGSSDEGTEAVVVTVRIKREGAAIFNQAYELASRLAVAGNLTYEANYTVVVSHGNRVETVELSRSTFDCNISGTEVMVAKSGLGSETGSTLVYCPEDPPGDD